MKQRETDFADVRELIALEQELAELKKQHGIQEKSRWWMKIGDWLAERTAKAKMVERKKYIHLALYCGWFCGAHRFYAGQKVLGILYLLFCWTGIPLAMTLIDLMIALPMQPDTNGMIQP